MGLRAGSRERRQSESVGLAQATFAVDLGDAGPDVHRGFLTENRSASTAASPGVARWILA